MKNFNRTILSCAICAHLGFSVAVQAEEALEQMTNEEQQETVQEDASSIEVIMVTANKRSQTTQAVAAGITAMSGDMLVDRNITDPRDLSKVVPSMVTGSGSRGEATINIRGVGYNEVGSAGVAIHVDGVYQPRSSMGRTVQMDMNRVEVLRGPQSTLYGRNANGGVVNYITAAPTTEDVEGTVTIGYADYDQSRLGATINVPLNDDFSARASIEKFERKDGFIKNVAVPGNDMDTLDSLAARIAIAGDLTDNATLHLIGTYSDTKGAVSYVNSYEESVNPRFAAETKIYDPFTTTVDAPATGKIEYRALTSIIDWDINENWVLKSTTGYQDYKMDRSGDFDGTDVSAIVNDTEEASDTFTQEFSLSGEIGNVDTVFGLFYMDDDFAQSTSFNFTTLFPFPTPPGFPPLETGYGPFAAVDDAFHLEAESYDTESFAVFADGTWNVSDDFRIIAGIRYSNDKQTIVQNVRQEFAFPTRITVQVCTEADSMSIKDDNILGRAGFQYDLSSTSNIYATYSEGVKIGGINPRAATCNDTYEPEEITSYEAGWKSMYLDGALSLNFSAFFYDYKNLQTQAIVGTAVDINNAPGSEVKGLEIDTNWVPDDHWNITASLSLINAEYTEFENVNVMTIPPNAPPTYPSVIVDLEGQSLNYSPDVSSNVSIGYTTDPIIALGNGTLNLRTDINYRSEITLREFEREGDTTDAYTIVDLSAVWLSESEKYKVRVYANNVTEDSYKVFMGASNQNGARAVRWNTPRVIGAEFMVNF